MALWADFDPKVWRQRRRIQAGGGVTRVTLDAAVYAHAAEALADLRVIRDEATEVPYLLSVARSRVETAAVNVRLVNRESRGGALMATLEFDGQQVHNRLELQTTREDFRSEVRVEASDDGRVWASVRAGAYVFRYKTDDGRVAEHLTIQYPDSRRRLLRLTIANWPEAAEFTGAAVTRSAANAARRSSLWSATAAPVDGARRKTSCYVLATGTRAPRDRVVVRAASAPATFHRSVTLEQSEDGKAWRWWGVGALYRTAADESLTLEFSETNAPWQRLCIEQGDDVPVRLESVRVEGIDREVTFRSEAAGAYWLYVGHLKAAAPSYDLARTAPADFVESAVVGRVEPMEANPRFTPPVAPVPPWTDRYPALLYGVLGVAIAGLGWMALKLLRTS